MNDASPAPQRPRLGIDQISTRWSLIVDPVQFVMRYAPAIRSYLEALLRSPHDAEEVAQEFFLKVCQRGFAPEKIVHSRFRNYLKTAVRNTALTFLSRARAARHGSLDAVGPAVTDEQFPQADEEWVAQWRQCLLARAWQALKRHQHESPGNLFHTVLSLAVEHPEDDSRVQAARIGERFSAEAFRKQLSRARRKFAESLVREVAQTLESPTPLSVEEELIDIGLMKYVRAFLPADWRKQGMLAGPDR